MSDAELLSFAYTAPPPNNSNATLAESFLAIEQNDKWKQIRTDESTGYRITEHFRPDGTVFVRDERAAGYDGGLHLISRSGRILAHWRSANEFYFTWIDHIVGADPSVIVCDSKYVSSFLYNYHRPKVRIISAFHGAHLAHDATSAYGPFRRSRAEILIHNEQFDGLQFLTKRQEQDFRAAFGRTKPTFVIPNAVDSPAAPPEASRIRQAGAGIMAGTLYADKRVDHGIESVRRLHLEGHLGIELDIYGEGPERARLERGVREAGLIEKVRFGGFDPKVTSRFDHASFVLLCSKYEGWSLILPEAMSRGCIPIAYDIKYGPSDIITDAVDGFLVSPGDIDELSKTIARFVSMGEAEQLRMRRAAIRRADSFNVDSVARMWKGACEAVLVNDARWTQVGYGARVDQVRQGEADGEVTLALHGAIFAPHSYEKPRLRMLGISRNRRFAFDLNLEEASRHEPSTFTVGIPVNSLPAEGGVYDFWITAYDAGQRLRLSAAPDLDRQSIKLSSTLSLDCHVTMYGNFSLRFRTIDPSSEGDSIAAHA